MGDDWRDIYQRFPGKWVALDLEDQHTVLAADVDANKVYAQALQQGRRIVLHRVPEAVIDFVGYEICL